MRDNYVGKSYLLFNLFCVTGMHFSKFQTYNRHALDNVR